MEFKGHYYLTILHNHFDCSDTIEQNVNWIELNADIISRFSTEITWNNMFQ